LRFLNGSRGQIESNKGAKSRVYRRNIAKHSRRQNKIEMLRDIGCGRLARMSVIKIFLRDYFCNSGKLGFGSFIDSVFIVELY